MSPLIMVGIAVATLLTVIVAYLSQHNDRQAKMRVRNLGRFKERIRKLDNIILGVPANYLPKTLKVLIYASIVETLRNINALSPGEKLDKQIDKVKETLDQLLKQNSPEVSQSANDIDAAQLKECKYLLKDLHSLILEFHNEGLLNHANAQKHLQIVRQTLLKVTLDTYSQLAARALADSNKNLALHYYSIALARLQQTTDSAAGSNQEGLKFYQQKVDQLKGEIIRDTVAAAEEMGQDADQNLGSQWQNLDKKEDEDWDVKRY